MHEATDGMGSHQFLNNNHPKAIIFSHLNL